MEQNTSRKETEIDALILRAADNEAGSTKLGIMFNSFLSFFQVEYFLERLVNDNLLEYLAGEMKYRTTAKGLWLLKESERVENPGPCQHQCTRCGVIYECKGSRPCSGAFHLGKCARCVALFDYKVPETALSY